MKKPIRKSLGDYLSEKYPNKSFVMKEITDEKTHTNETFDKKLDWQDNSTKPIWNDIKDDFISWEAEENKNSDVIFARRDAYKSLGGFSEQLDMIYHDIDNWKSKIKEIKDANPKVE